MLVFLFHAKYEHLDGGWIGTIGRFGHEAVMIFFVLSGFVIAYISQVKEDTPGLYFKSRFARLYSVAIPALFITLVLDYFGSRAAPELYVWPYYQASEPVHRFLVNLLFVNQLWFENVRAFSNGPYWSLSYEFWYYVIFAAAFYYTGAKRFFFTAAACLIAGPKILLLFPIWLMGVACFHLSQKLHISLLPALLLTVMPLAAYIVYWKLGYHKDLIDLPAQLWGWDFYNVKLRHSRQFFNDYVLGAAVATHLLGIIALSRYFSFPAFLEKPIRYFAGMTFAVYLMHYPFLYFFGSYLDRGPAIALATFVSIVLLAPLTEGKKREWAALIDKVADWGTQTLAWLALKLRRAS